MTVSRGDSSETTLSHATAFIRQCHASHSPETPLFVGIQGCQGSGKTYLTSQLVKSLAPLRVAVLSLDDLYLPYPALLRLMNGSNKLLHGRGLPGTHDLPLGIDTLYSLQAGERCTLPTFDKSRFGGIGDRSDEVRTIEGRVDVVILEGWMTGFHCVTDATLASAYNTPNQYLRKYSLADMLEVNALLKNYNALWDILNVYVHLKPQTLEFVWEWRLQQEHEMKRVNGGHGMSDDQVKAFISRYMPAYEIYQKEGFQSGKPSLVITLDQSRRCSHVAS